MVRNKSPSLTATFVAIFRAIGNQKPLIPTFSDPIAKHFLSPRLVKLSEIGAASITKPGAWFELLRSISAMMQFRTVEIDTYIKDNMPIDQLVILGAGLDCRAWRMNELSNVILFEVDHPATQEWKKQQAKAIVSKLQSKTMKYVPVDFTKDDLPTCLEVAGFDRKKRTFWILEGVTMYLKEEDVKRTMRLISELSEGGGILSLTYLNSAEHTRVRGLFPFFLRLIGEPIKFSCTSKEIEILAILNGQWKTLRNVNYKSLNLPILKEQRNLLWPFFFTGDAVENVWHGEVNSKLKN